MANVNKKWNEANKSATKKYGISLNDLVKKRKSLSKDSDEYKVVQNAINDVLGSNKVREVGMSKGAMAADKMGMTSKLAKVGKKFNEEKLARNTEAFKRLDPVEQRMDKSLSNRKKAVSNTTYDIMKQFGLNSSAKKEKKSKKTTGMAGGW